MLWTTCVFPWGAASLSGGDLVRARKYLFHGGGRSEQELALLCSASVQCVWSPRVEIPPFCWLIEIRTTHLLFLVQFALLTLHRICPCAVTASYLSFLPQPANFLYDACLLILDPHCASVANVITSYRHGFSMT